MVGVVGLYVNIIFLEVKRRANCIIDTIAHKRDGNGLTRCLDTSEPASS